MFTFIAKQCVSNTKLHRYILSSFKMYFLHYGCTMYYCSQYFKLTKLIPLISTATSDMYMT